MGNITTKRTIIKNGLFFDGSAKPGCLAHLLIENGRVKRINPNPIDEQGTTLVIDAEGHWVTPGFIDIHTHYDAEVEANPALDESVRHGVTTCFLGSCSLSVAVGDPEDLADQFTRVEAIPRPYLIELLKQEKNWHSFSEYVDHLNALPLGPNLASFVGYSAVRSHVMGLERSLTKGERPSGAESKVLQDMIVEGFQAGCIGLSLNTLYWDKMGGSRFRSRCLPCTYASWSELRRAVALTRHHDLVLQTVPNISTKYELLFYAMMSAGMHFRKPLKTTLVSLMDIRSNRAIYKVLQLIGNFFNKILGADFRYQALPNPFDLWADGFDLVVFEEFGAGAAALHLEQMAERKKLFGDSGYRNWFKRQWRNPFLPKVFHRNFAYATVMDCPDKTLIGQSFSQIGRTAGTHPVDTFLDLVTRYGNDLRWYTMMGNDRPKPLASILNHPSTLMGFSDAGAHLRNMAYYNFPLRMLKFVRDSHLRGEPIMPIESAIWRLTGELGDWFNIDAGSLKVGRRADLVIIDPEYLDESVDEIHEATMPQFGDYRRLVRRNNRAIKAVMINGRIAVKDGEPVQGLGRDRGYGQFLPSLKSP